MQQQTQQQSNPNPTTKIGSNPANSTKNMSFSNQNNMQSDMHSKDKTNNTKN